jgi:hypothetical protein
VHSRDDALIFHLLSTISPPKPRLQLLATYVRACAGREGFGEIEESLVANYRPGLTQRSLKPAKSVAQSN